MCNNGCILFFHPLTHSLIYVGFMYWINDGLRCARQLIIGYSFQQEMFQSLFLTKKQDMGWFFGDCWRRSKSRKERKWAGQESRPVFPNHLTFLRRNISSFSRENIEISKWVIPKKQQVLKQPKTCESDKVQ